MEEKKLTALEALQKVKEAEARAKSLVESTREREVPLILEQARIEAKARAEEVLRRAREESEMKKQSIVAKAKEEAELIKDETRKELARIEAQAEAQFAAACEALKRLIAEELRLKRD
jgi:vacuolar-type H+-ATPase subunit H